MRYATTKHVLDLRNAAQGITAPLASDARSDATLGKIHGQKAQALPCALIPKAPNVTAPLLRIAALVLSIVGMWQVLPAVTASIAYFTDTEATSGRLSAALLELDAEGGGDETLACGTMKSFPVYVELTKTRAAQYAVSVEQATGDAALCDLLRVEAWLKGERLYPTGGSGKLLDLGIEGVTESGLWDFRVELPSSAQSIPDGSYCMVDIVFRAWCPMTGAFGDGFFDEDRVTLTVRKEGCEGDECLPCPGGVCGDVSIEVVNENHALVENTVTVTANTGGNSANGGDGGEGGAGGGGGGNGGAGGTITTGNSSASVSITNVVNANETTITVSGCCKSCPCDTSCSSACSDTSVSSMQVGAGEVTAASLRDELEARVDEAFTQIGMPRLPRVR